jgi:hypothetical protein
MFAHPEVGEFMCKVQVIFNIIRSKKCALIFFLRMNWLQKGLY